MRIMWICGGLLPDGLAAIGLADMRVNGGFMNALLTQVAGAEKGNEFCVLAWDRRRCDVKVGNVRHVSFGGDSFVGLPSATNCAQARKVIEEFSPDVIHILGTEGVFSHLPRDVFGEAPVVISMQGVMSACAEAFPGGLAPGEIKWSDNFNFRFLRHGLTLWREQSVWRNVRARNEADTIRRHRYFIGRTDFDEAWVRYYNPQAVYYRVNETMRTVFYRSERKGSTVRRHTIFCGGAAGYPLKGAHWLVRAVAALRAEFPDIQLRIANAITLDCGCSWKDRVHDGAYPRYLRRLIKELRVADHLSFLPVLSAAEVKAELEAAELFVLPSLCENSPNALCEAMLVGVPCIATFVGGVPSILEDKKTGLLVPPNDPAQLASAIRKFLNDPNMAKALAAEAKRVAFVRHDAETNSKAQLDVYRKIMEDAK